MKRCTGCGKTDEKPLGLNLKGEPFLACCPDNDYREITALQWVEAKFLELETTVGVYGSMYEIIEQAKHIEKEQIIKAWMAKDNELQRLAAENYYKRTYYK